MPVERGHLAQPPQVGGAGAEGADDGEVDQVGEVEPAVLQPAPEPLQDRVGFAGGEQPGDAEGGGHEHVDVGGLAGPDDPGQGVERVGDAPGGQHVAVGEQGRRDEGLSSAPAQSLRTAATAGRTRGSRAASASAVAAAIRALGSSVAASGTTSSRKPWIQSQEQSTPAATEARTHTSGRGSSQSERSQRATGPRTLW